MKCTVCSTQCMVYSIQCKLHIVHNILYIHRQWGSGRQQKYSVQYTVFGLNVNVNGIVQVWGSGNVCTVTIHTKTVYTVHYSIQPREKYYYI